MEGERLKTQEQTKDQENKLIEAINPMGRGDALIRLSGRTDPEWSGRPLAKVQTHRARNKTEHRNRSQWASKRNGVAVLPE